MNPLGHIAAAGAEEDVTGLQQVADTIDEVFGNATGFFVNLIFGTEVTIPLGNPLSGGRYALGRPSGGPVGCGCRHRVHHLLQSDPVHRVQDVAGSDPRQVLPG